MVVEPALERVLVEVAKDLVVVVVLAVVAAKVGAVELVLVVLAAVVALEVQGLAKVVAVGVEIVAAAWT